MKLRWIYLGLLAAFMVATLVVQRMGSTEVASHAISHLTIAAIVTLLVWFIKRPISAPNLWLWRAGWGISASQMLDAAGAFGYDDRATSAVPGLYFVHSTVAPAVFVGSFLLLLGAAVAVPWPRLPLIGRVAMATVVLGGGLFFLATLAGLGL
ncbi:MAG: hypothetical protein WD651_13800 [Acidimicrobiia bacterium]